MKIKETKNQMNSINKFYDEENIQLDDSVFESDEFYKKMSKTMESIDIEEKVDDILKREGVITQEEMKFIEDYYEDIFPIESVYEDEDEDEEIEYDEEDHTFIKAYESGTNKIGETIYTGYYNNREFSFKIITGKEGISKIDITDVVGDWSREDYEYIDGLEADVINIVDSDKIFESQSLKESALNIEFYLDGDEIYVDVNGKTTTLDTFDSSKLGPKVNDAIENYMTNQEDYEGNFEEYIKNYFSSNKPPIDFLITQRDDKYVVSRMNKENKSFNEGIEKQDDIQNIIRKGKRDDENWDDVKNKIIQNLESKKMSVDRYKSNIETIGVAYPKLSADFSEEELYNLVGKFRVKT